LAAEKRKEISLSAQVRAAEVKQEAISIADEKRSNSLSDNLDAIGIAETDTSQKDVEKEKEKDRLTENTPEVRQEVTLPKAHALSSHCYIHLTMRTQ
jgi:lipase chaperone LimK